MKKIGNLRGHLLTKMIAIFSFMVMTLVLVVSITGTHHHIVWYKVLIVTIGWLAILAGIFIILKTKENWLECHERAILFMCCLLWGILLYLFSCMARTMPKTDYEHVWEGAMTLAAGGEVQWWYFALWKNNFPLMIILTILFRISEFLRIQDPFYFVLFIVVLLTVWTGMGIYRLLRMTNNSVSICFLGLLVFMMFIPAWEGTHVFYTDNISLCFGIQSVCILISALKNDKPFPYLLLGGSIAGIGFAIKATSGISILAISLAVLFLTDIPLKKCIRFIGGVITGMVLPLLVVQLLWTRFPCYEMEYEYSAPLEYWIALGMAGNGGYGENEGFAIKCLAASGKDSKRLIAGQFMEEHWDEAWSMTHLISKMRYNFASGNMGLSEFTGGPEEAFFELFNDYGKYGGYMTMLTSGYFYALLILGLLGGFLNFLSKGLDISEWQYLLKMTTIITILGMILFLMLWEANNRQLYNHMPWFALFAALGCGEIAKEYIKKRKSI